MYCSNCGAKVKEKDNFCNVCGYKLKENIRVNISVDETPTKNIGDTQVFDFKGKLDSINHNDDIGKIMHTLDKEISREILKHTRSEFSEGFVGPKSKIDDEPLDFNIDKPLKPNVEKEKSNKIEVSKELKNPLDEKTETKEKKSRSIKDIWNSFVNEDDDEYSIFANLGEEKTPIKNKSEIVKTENTFAGNMEQTMPIGIITDEILEDERLKEIQEKEKNKISENNTTKKDIEKAVKNSLQKEEFKSPNEDVQITHNSFYNEVNKQLEENKQNNLSEKQSNGSFLQNLLGKFKRAKTEKKPETSSKDTVINTVKKTEEDSFNLFLKINNLINSTLGKVNPLGRTGLIYLLIIGTIFSSIPIFVIEHSISFRLVLLAIFKVAVNVCCFYFPLSIATERSDTSNSNDKLIFSTVVNWLISTTLILIGFFIYAFLGYRTFIMALSPGIVTTIILYIVSTIIALSLYIEDLDKNDLINFIGWYSILFILFELILKLLWVVIDFVS